MTKIALLSVSDETRVMQLAVPLHELGYNMVATSGTRAKVEYALQYQTSVGDMEYFAAKTIGRATPLAREQAAGVIAGGIHEGREKEIEIVVCNFRQPRIDKDKIVRDLGGPHLVSAAAMSHRLVVIDPADYDELIDLLEHTNTTKLDEFQSRMNLKALSAVAEVHREVAFLHREPLVPESTPTGIFATTPRAVVG